MKRVANIGALFLAACSPEPQIRELSNVSVNALMAQPVPQFFATLRVSNRLANECPSVSYDERAARALADARTRNAAGQYAAVQNSAGIELESDVAWRSLLARYEGQNACEAAAGEIERETAVSAVLVSR